VISTYNPEGDKEIKTNAKWFGRSARTERKTKKGVFTSYNSSGKPVDKQHQISHSETLMSICRDKSSIPATGNQSYVKENAKNK